MLLYYNFPIHFTKDAPIIIDSSMMKKEMNEMIKLFNEKIDNLERKQKEDIENLEKNHNEQINNFKTEITNLKSENVNDKTEINNLKKRIEMLECCINFPLELVEGIDKSLFTLKKNLIEFNTNGKFCSVFLNKQIVEVFSFFFFFFFNLFYFLGNLFVVYFYLFISFFDVLIW
jgi:wobble nucleotide-excising tRNase